MDNKLIITRIVLLCSITFFLCTSIFLLKLSISDINEDQKVLEIKNNTNIDVDEFRFEKHVLVLFGITISGVFLFGIIAVYIKSVCMLLFYSTTGCGMFILLLLILYVNSIVSTSTLLLLTIGNLLSAFLAAYYAFYNEDANYKLMQDKPYTINLI